MKHYIAILLALFLSFNTLKADNDDTTRIPFEKSSCKQQIINKLFDCFVISNFDSLVPFCESTVDYYMIRSDSKVFNEMVTDYKLASYLNSIFKGLNYEQFKIASAKNSNNEVVLLVKVYMFKDENNNESSEDIKIYFVLGPLETIRKVIIK